MPCHAAEGQFRHDCNVRWSSASIFNRGHVCRLQPRVCPLAPTLDLDGVPSVLVPNGTHHHVRSPCTRPSSPPPPGPGLGGSKVPDEARKHGASERAAMSCCCDTAAEGGPDGKRRRFFVMRIPRYSYLCTSSPWDRGTLAGQETGQEISL